MTRSALFRRTVESAAQYLNHRYGTRSLVDLHEDAELDLQDALDFYKHYYSPNKLFRRFSGDVELTSATVG